MKKIFCPKFLYLGLCDYHSVHDYMRTFTASRSRDTHDEILLLQHLPVYTQGQSGSSEHVIEENYILQNNIEIVRSDRGGQITYHGPGQLIIYFMLDLARMHIGIRTLVCIIEDLLINYLKTMNIDATKVCNAPGVYVGKKKIASLGFRVKNSCTYHGIALNIDMDLSPFNYINPCGFKGLNMTQIRDFVPMVTLEKVSLELVPLIINFLTNR